jgi:hypoxanthine phosphoribosyltransferase
MKKEYVHWDTFDELLSLAIEKINDADLGIDTVVGLSRGGLIPGVMASHQLDDIPFVAVDYSSAHGKGDNRGAHYNTIPGIDAEHILLVDDIADSGHTMFEVAEQLHQRGHQVTSYVFYWKTTSVFQPDYYSRALGSDAPWIVFPWEL